MNRHFLNFLAFAIIVVLATGCAPKIGSLSNEFSDDGWDLDESADDELYGNSSAGTGEYDGSGSGIFGRRIVYRDLSAVKAAINESGKVVTKVCINRAGNVTYVELLEGATLKDREGLKLYLKAARGYKFQPDPTAPKEQCGKLTFTVNNTVNNQLRAK